MIFSVRQLKEKCREQRQDLHLLFIDLTKSFDTVCRTGLWYILDKLGCPAKFTQMVRSFHDGMLARILEHGMVSEPIPVTNGVKQGCVLAPKTLQHPICHNVAAGSLQVQCRCVDKLPY